ncbi:MAG: hypothetical protein ACOY71_10530 [Gemmatimonadota bacterium]
MAIDWKAKWQELLQEVEQERDELRVKVALGKAELRDEWKELDGRIDALRAKFGAGSGEVKEDLQEKWTVVRDELKSAFARIRERLAADEPPKRA